MFDLVAESVAICFLFPLTAMQALLHSSHLYHEAAHNMASHGISVGEVSMDVGKMMEGKTTKVEQLTGGIEYLCKKYKVTSIFVQYFDTVM